MVIILEDPYIMEIQKYLLPIFFIILFILGIYFILFKKNKEYYENQIHSVINPSTEHFSDNSNNLLKKLANGLWSTPYTEVEGDSVKGLVFKIVIKEDENQKLGKGSVILTSIDNINDESNKIPIILFSNKYILAENEGNRIEFDFKENKLNPNPLQSEKIPMAQVTYQGYIIPIFNSFKILDSKIIGGKFSRILQSKQYLNTNIKEKYDLNTYQKYLNYKYPNKPFIVKYDGVSSTLSESNSFYKKLKDEYYDNIYLSYRREYATVDNETVITNISKPYLLNLKSGSNYFSEIILNNIDDENKINNILKPFVLKKTYVYIYIKDNKKLDIYSVKYYPANFTKDDLNFKNNFEQEFLNKKIKIQNIDAIKAKDKSLMNTVLLNTYVMTSNNMSISIYPRDIESKI